MAVDNPFSAPVVNADWLGQNTGAVGLADVRWSIPTGPKLADFENRHIPGSVFVDLDDDLSDPPGHRGRHPLPSVGHFRAALDRLGLADRPVVCYDDTSGATAARMWWMLQAIDIPCAVLDGGIDTWPGPWAAGPNNPAVDPGKPGRPPIHDVHEDWPDTRLVAVADVLPAVDGGAVLLDARSGQRFAGEPNPIDPTPGHIPGARSRPWTENVDDNGRLLAVDELRRQFAAHGVEPASTLIASCGSGVTACHNLLAAAVAGLPPGRLYAGSWSEWISDSSRPVAVG